LLAERGEAVASLDDDNVLAGLTEETLRDLVRGGGA
jgi:hypothetical protein